MRRGGGGGGGCAAHPARMRSANAIDSIRLITNLPIRVRGRADAKGVPGGVPAPKYGREAGKRFRDGKKAVEARCGTRTISEAGVRIRRFAERETGGPLRRSVAIGAVLLAVCFLILYVLTMSPGVYLGDSGELAAAGALLDIPHPPGYPLYTLLARLFVVAGFGPIAARANALSAIAGAVSIALFFLLARSRFSATAALLGALLLGFSSLLWSQAAVAEVYALHLAIFLLFLLVVSHADSARRRISAAWIGGLAAAAHPLGFGLFPLLLVAGWANGNEGRSKRALLLQAFAFLAPLSLFLYLPIRSACDPPTDWGNPETARAFWSHVLRLGYRDVPKPDASFSLWFGEMVALVRGASGNIGAPLLALAPLGLFSPALRRRRGFLVPLAGFLLYGPLLAAYVRFPLAPERVEENSVFFLPALALLLFFVSSGADLLLAACRGRRPLHAGLIATFGIVAAVRFGSALPSHRYDQVALPEAYARDVLTGVPSGATLVAAGDDMVFPLLFLQRALGVRPDVDIRDADGIVFPAPEDRGAGGRYFTYPAPGLAPAGLH
ncbi:MAG: DUF2723 domain-containing protein, partial [Candidatus Latescibacterota bacterium]